MAQNTSRTKAFVVTVVLLAMVAGTAGTILAGVNASQTNETDPYQSPPATYEVGTNDDGAVEYSLND